MAQAADPETGGRLSDQALKSEILTLLLAGHETTAHALTWAIYLLSCHPNAQQKLADEVSVAIGRRSPTAQDLPKLTYTQMVIDETLRLYPPLWAFSRRAERDDIVCGYRIPKGARLLVSPYVVHRLPEFWSDPERFVPERFSPEGSAQKQSHAYIPFGAGPRQCIGKRFATLQMQLILPMIMQEFRVGLTSSQTTVTEASVTLQPAQPLWISLTPATT